MAQSVKHPTLDFGSGHDLTGLWIQAPHQGSVFTVQRPFGIFSLSLSLSLFPCPYLACLRTLSLSNKNNKKEEGI